MEKRTRSGTDVENPQRRNADRAVTKLEMKITFVTTVRSQSAERQITPGTEESQSIDTVKDPMKGEIPSVRACAILGQLCYFTQHPNSHRNLDGKQAEMVVCANWRKFTWQIDGRNKVAKSLHGIS
jgi:hypothetical protein